MPINHGAGRGGLLIVPVRLEDDEELPFVLIVEKASDRNGGNWGLWLDPVLSR